MGSRSLELQDRTLGSAAAICNEISSHCSKQYIMPRSIFLGPADERKRPYAPAIRSFLSIMKQDLAIHTGVTWLLIRHLLAPLSCFSSCWDPQRYIPLDRSISTRASRLSIREIHLISGCRPRMRIVKKPARPTASSRSIIRFSAYRETRCRKSPHFGYPFDDGVIF